MSEKTQYNLPAKFIKFADTIGLSIGNEGGMPFVDESDTLHIQFEGAMQGKGSLSSILQLADMLGENRMKTVIPNDGNIFVRFNRGQFEKAFN